jgi:hypothetical protein
VTARGFWLSPFPSQTASEQNGGKNVVEFPPQNQLPLCTYTYFLYSVAEKWWNALQREVRSCTAILNTASEIEQLRRED